MKLKGGYRYYARLSSDELQIIKNALELLLNQYDHENHMHVDFFKKAQTGKEVRTIINALEEVEHAAD